MGRREKRERLTPRRPINLSNGAFRHLAAALGLGFAAFLAGQVRADWTLKTADAKEQQHLVINTWNMTDGLSATSQGGGLVTFQTRNILSLASGKQVAAHPASRGWKLTLRNGDVLYGRPVGASGKNLQFRMGSRELDGEVDVPLKYIAALTNGAGENGKIKKVPEAIDDDLIVFKQADNLKGLFVSVDDAAVKFRADGSDEATDISLDTIDTIVFGGAKPTRAVPPLSLRLTFTSGTVLTVPLSAPQSFDWAINTLKVTSGGKQHTVDVEGLVSAEVIGARVVYLTELDIAGEEQVSFFGSNWPAQINRNALGQPMKIAHTQYDRGIGVHTQSTLTYELDGTFDTLSLRVGVDDSAAPNGEAKASIVLDGKTLWTSKTLKAGELSDELSLPIKNGKKLELHADPADHLDVQGRVDWVNVALQRK